VTPVGLDRSLGMLREAASGCRPVQGDLVALPFQDAAFDRVMCNHVLYHVSDRLAALHELRRVTRPGGRVVLATNSVRTMERLHGVTEAAARDAGAGPPLERGNPFRLEDLEEVRSVLPGAVERERQNELVFPDADGVLAYVATAADVPSGFLDALRRRVEEIVEREGAFRTVAISGCFVAEV
jgi:SAM-dependent methyltransferase